MANSNADNHDIGSLFTEERIRTFKNHIANSQNDLTVLLENVHDKHNIGAVIRSCDAVGIREIYILYTDPRLQKRYEEVGISSSTGVVKWIKIHYYEDLTACILALRNKYERIIGTHLNSEATSLYTLDFNVSSVIAFGNEHEGLTKDVLSHCDTNMIIPQFGMVQSLNISVACAVTLFEACRQRLAGTDSYDRAFDEQNKEHNTKLREYMQIHLESKYPRED